MRDKEDVLRIISSTYRNHVHSIQPTMKSEVRAIKFTVKKSKR